VYSQYQDAPAPPMDSLENLKSTPFGQCPRERSPLSCYQQTQTSGGRVLQGRLQGGRSEAARFPAWPRASEHGLKLRGSERPANSTPRSKPGSVAASERPLRRQPWSLLTMKYTKDTKGEQNSGTVTWRSHGSLARTRQLGLAQELAHSPLLNGRPGNLAPEIGLCRGLRDGGWREDPGMPARSPSWRTRVSDGDAGCRWRELPAKL
jgi:hypothetical protein